MLIPLEYDLVVRRLAPHCALFAVATLCATLSFAQINGAPASVASPGFGGRAVNGVSPSVTSLGPGGYSAGSRATFSTAPSPGHGTDAQRHHRNQGEYLGPSIYAVPVPYAVDNGGQDYAEEGEADPNYQGGPTVFDRRGAGARSYVPPVPDAAAAHADNVAGADSDAAPAVPTLLVFKDGRKLEVGNYAIVSSTLFDLTPGHARRIALAELDLPATRQQNEDRGVVFQLPASTQGN